MHFMLIGLFKPGARAELSRLQMEWNEHLAQQALRIAGPLLDDSGGGQRGWMAVLEAGSLDSAWEFLHHSPYFAAGLFERLEAFPLAIEVGRVD